MPEEPAPSDVLTPEQLLGIFEDYFEDTPIVDGTEPLWVLDLKDLNRRHDEVIPMALKHPRNVIAAAAEALERCTPVGGPGADATVRWTVRLGDPTKILEDEVEVSGLRAERIGELVAVPGVVAQISPVAFKLQTAVYKCVRCGSMLSVPQGEYETPPLECYEEQGGCSRSLNATKFELRHDLSVWANAQRIEIQESPERTEGRLPERMSLLLYGSDLVGRLKGGNRIRAWGILCVHEATGKARRTTRERYLEVQGFAILEEDAGQVRVSTEDAQRIEVLAKRPEVYNELRDSIAPFIMGYDEMKEATVLQLFGGVEKAHVRGDIHQLICGDPAVAKSQFLLAVARCTPRGGFITAPQATHAGLTAWAQQENVFGATKWVVEAGAMPLSDRAGVLCIDELDKMKDEDRRKINPAMDPQQFSITKAGGNYRMVSRVPILAAANPKLARFDEHKYIGEQIEISPDTLSRFDCIWPIVDRPSLQWDTALAERILNDEDGFPVSIEADLFRKYIAHARQVAPKPTMSDDAKALITEFYKKERQKSWGVGAIAMTPRQLGALRRLAEASARVQLRTAVDVTDAERAVRLVSTWMRMVAGEEGRFDIDIVQTGISHTQREQIIVLRDLIASLMHDSPDNSARYEDIVQAAQQQGIPPDKTDAWLKRWAQEGEIYQRSSGRYQLIEKL